MKSMSEKWTGVLLFFLLFGSSGSGIVSAEETATKTEKKERTAPAGASLVDSLSLTSRHEPIHISSRTLEFRYEEKRIIYYDDVVAIQGDVTLKSALLTVLYEDAPPSDSGANGTKKGKPEQATKPENSPGAQSTTAKQRLKEIIAEGSVEITSGDRRATAKKAVFNEAQRIVVLSGDAIMRERGNQVTGERVTVYLDEKRSEVHGGGGSRRAEMILIPEQVKEEGKGVKKP